MAIITRDSRQAEISVPEIELYQTRTRVVNERKEPKFTAYLSGSVDPAVRTPGFASQGLEEHRGSRSCR
ncbi:MAG: hypothetical protein AUJ92_00910 [Armatimonadetes bacterium CG2_30_59_28]|nr:MAG: hypothetical protein AUJ92_00910 [Armatimonadetes bacterium CG2_30_59_28]